MDVRVLGPIEVRIAEDTVGVGGQKQRAVLGLLAAAVPHVVPTDALLQGIWGADVSRSAKATLQTYVWNLRQVLGEVLVHDRGGYRLDVDPEALDAVRFLHALESARTELTTDPAGTAVRLRDALGWWRGLPYADLMGVPGLEGEVRRLEQLRLEAVELRIDAELAVGYHGELVAELEALADEYPTRERFRAQHMVALYRSGRQTEALRAYRRTEAYLAEQVGVDPSQELQDLELKILQHDQSLMRGVDRTITQRLAVLVTDIEASTRLWDLHPQAMAEALTRHDRLMGEAMEGTGGRLFKHTGDGILAVFPTTSAAVIAAEVALRSVAATDWAEVGDIRVRMAIDVGEVETRGDDFFGPPLNRAARLCSIAHGGQLLVSAGAQAEVADSAPPGLQTRHLGEVHLRGMAAPERIAQLVFVGLPADFPELRTHDAASLDDRTPVLSLPGYELRDQIGEGAFGVVWRAYQPSVGREVAIKVIRPELASHPSFVRRFEAEARTIARLGHPHIVPLIDFWRDSDRAFLVLALLRGGSLEQALRRGGVETMAGLRILEQLASALDHAHSLGLTHGDLKPANVLLDGAGNAYLSDFGIGSRLVDADAVSWVSSARHYRAPEEPETGPCAEADRFALGMLARELLDGAGELESVLARATAPNPVDRYQTGAAFVGDLAEVLGRDPQEAVPPTVSRNPYKGLRAFDEADAADFYGRGDLVAALVEATSRSRFVTVVGPSGSGKSSVVRAGLLTALASEAVDGSDHWFTLVFTPGQRPLESLAGALNRLFGRDVDPADLSAADLNRIFEPELGEGELLLVVDQFEELYTLVDDPEVRRRFTDLLVDVVESQRFRVRVVATLRADFYDRPLADDRLGPLVKDGQVTVLPPSREEYVEMVAAPAQAVGLRWEPGLPHRIAEDVAHQSGGLPLLQYALTELVERRGGDLLTGSDYDRVGGVAGALASRAEAVYRSLTPAQQEAARQVLLRLLTVDEATDDTRLRVRRSELESLGTGRSDLDTVLDRLVSERLLLADRDPVTRGPSIEVAHEALLREWPRLASWIDDQREALILSRRFRVALADWAASGRHADYLLTGHRLAPYEGWAETAALTTEERHYYLASRTKDETDRSARRRRRRTITGVLGGAALVAALLGVIAVLQAGRATTERDRAVAAESDAEVQAQRAEAAAAEAESAAQLARSRELAASAINALSDDPTLAKLLALSAAEIAEPPLEVISALHTAYAADRVVARYDWPEDDYLWTDLHPSGDRLVASGGGVGAFSADYLEVADVDTGTPLWSYRVEESAMSIGPARFSPDGERVVAGVIWESDDDPPSHAGPLLGIHVWDAETGEHLERFDVGRCGGMVNDLTATHMVVRTWPDDGDGCRSLSARIELIDLRTASRRVLSRRSPIGADRWAALSGDGRIVAYDFGDEDQRGVRVVEVASGNILLEFDPITANQGGIGVWELSHDGSLMLYGDFPIQVWDVARGEVMASFGGHAGEVSSMVFAPDGLSVYSTGRDLELRRWDPTTGEELAVWPAIGSGRPSASRDGRVLVPDIDARTAFLIHTGARGELGAVETCPGFTAAGSLDVTSPLAIFHTVCGNDHHGTTYLVDIEAAEVHLSLPGHGAQSLAVSPDGSRFVRQEAEGSVHGPVTIRDVESGEAIVELEGLCSWDSFSPAPRSENEGCGSIPDSPFPIWANGLAWSPDGSMIAVTDGVGDGTQDGYLALWDARTGDLLFTKEKPRGTLGYLLPFFGSGSKQVVVSHTGGWRAEAISTEDGATVAEGNLDRSLEGGDAFAFVGYTDERTLLAVGGLSPFGRGSLIWFDADTLEVTHSRHGLHEGSPKSMALSPDGSRLATGASDGFVRVWDTARGELVHELPVGETQVQGVAFLDDRHLAVTPQEGNLLIMTIDVEELLDIVRSSLTRGFTETECERYNFVDDCPTLQHLRRG